MRTLVALSIVVIAAGCTTVPVRRVGEFRPSDPTWLKAAGERVRYVGSIELPAHLGIEKGCFAKLWDAITGETGTHALYRPFGVAVSADGRIAVTDPGTRLARLYLPAEKRMVELTEGLESPLAVAFVDTSLVVADGAQATLRRFDASTGEAQQIPWPLPKFGRPTGLAYDAARHRLYVVDATLHCVHVVSTVGVGPLVLGARGENSGEFNFPTHVALGGNGNVYVTDSLNFRVQRFDENLKFVSTLGGLGDTAGDLPRSKGLTVDRRGTLWVVEGAFDVVQGFDESGELVGVFGGSGIDEGRFWLPAGIASDTSGHLYVADTWNARVQVFAIERVPAEQASAARLKQETSEGGPP